MGSGTPPGMLADMLAPGINPNMGGGDHAPARVDKFSEEIMFRRHRSGAAGPSSTKINGRFALRCSITNHRTTFANLDYHLNEVRLLGEEIVTTP